MSAPGLLRGVTAELSQRGSRRSVTVHARGRPTEWDAGLIALDRGYLTAGELLSGLERWERLGRGPALMDSLVEQGLLLNWQRREVQDLIDELGAPPVPWEELGAGD